MKNILVFAPHEDRSGRAAALAGQIAAKTGARITLLRVLEEKLARGARSDASAQQKKIRSLLVEVETQQVEKLGASLRSAGVPVSVEVCWGVPWEAVLDRVQRDQVDLVVKPASGLQRRGHVFFGATALHLFRRCPCPVWVVGNDGCLPGRLLAAIDPSGAKQRSEIASRILDWAEHVGKWSDAQVHIGTAWDAAGAEILRNQLAGDEWKRYVDNACAGARADLERTLEQRSTHFPDDRVHLVQGVAHEVLPELARDQQIDLVLMGTLARDGAAGDAIGETAETMIREVRSSVLTIPMGLALPTD